MIRRNFTFFTLCVFWLVQAFSLGMSDDEAYYWVLSQTPALGYVYHPPMVAWLISLSETLLGWASLPREVLVRLPGILLAAGSLAIHCKWLSEMRARTIWPVLPGIAAFGWMMVPDQSLFFAWSLGLYTCWRIIEGESASYKNLVALLASAAIGLLSKFSAVLFCFSALLSILFLSRERLRPLVALALGVILASIPILLWNSQNDWYALLYQFHSRHSGSDWSMRRYGLFWLSQLLIAGPLLILFTLKELCRSLWEKRAFSRLEKYLFIWFFPSSVFLIQPAYSPFKPHWAMIAWIPVLLLLCYRSTVNSKLLRYHSIYSGLLIALAFLMTQFPVVSLVQEKVLKKPANPLWDLSNDLVGWSKLPQALEKAALDPKLPVIGSRYQTASQAAFALWPQRAFTLAPKNGAETLEWPNLSQELEDLGPGKWPRVLRSVLYVHDDRYVQEPLFIDSSCEKSALVESKRFGLASKRIHLWLCQPKKH